MTEPEPKKTVTRALIIVAGVMLALLVVMSIVGALMLKQFVAATEGTWSAAPLSPAFARSRFDIEALPREVLQTQQLEGGLLDSFFFALLRIPPGSEEAFMLANGLSRDTTSESEAPVEQFEERIRAVTHATGPMRVTPLSGEHVGHLADGGERVWPVKATLLELDGQVWVALAAFQNM